MLSDTKIGINENLSGSWNDEASKKLVAQFGMIKSIIISPYIVISYAGNNINEAAHLFHDIKQKNYNLEKIIQKAFNIHNSAQINDIEFIIGYYEDKNKNELISIKDGIIVRNCKRAWLGSACAYYEFVRLEQEIAREKHKNLAVTDIGQTLDVHQELIVENQVYVYELARVFTTVVESGIDSCVGGLVVRVKMPEGENRLEYMGYKLYF